MSDTLRLPVDLQERIKKVASARGLSVDDFIRKSLEDALADNRETDSLLEDEAVYGNSGPSDNAANHDDYLYGDDS